MDLAIAKEKAQKYATEYLRPFMVCEYVGRQSGWGRYVVMPSHYVPTDFRHIWTTTHY